MENREKSSADFGAPQQSEQTSVVARHAPGPRTTAGKQRSSRNATKNGIFARALVLKQESRPEFNALLTKLKDELRPKGMLEALLVEELAGIIWRKRRFILAENAEISNTDKLKIIEAIQARRLEAWDRSRSGTRGGGVLKPTSNRFLIDEAKEMLTIFREGLEKTREKIAANSWVLTKLYGLDEDGEAPPGIARMLTCLLKLVSDDAHGTSDGSNSPDEYKKLIIELIDEEIKTLDAEQELQGSFENLKAEYRAVAALVPPQGAMDRLIRYETHLNREFDRLLNRLERVQRMRRGQPAPPMVNVEING